MPFLWNDKEFLFIGDDEPYDEAEYHVVRTLYVELKSKSHAISPAEIRPVFTKFGPVEDIDLGHTGVRACAYVTFTHDKDACLAMCMGKTGINRKIIQRILPAATKLQPTSTMQQPTSTTQQSADAASPNRNNTSLLMLGDHCLLEIFEYCDLHTLANVWKVCQRTRDLLEGFVSSKKNAYEINFTADKPEKTLNHVRGELECIGPHITKLRFAENSYSEFWTFGHNVPFYLKACNEYVGRSLKELELYAIPLNIFSGRNLALVQPLLLEIESLSIYVMIDEDFQNSIDIHVPKLKELKLGIGISDREIEVPLLRKTFPNLERAEIQMWYFVEEIEVFLKNHKKLQFLHIQCSSDERLYEIIAEESKEMKELVLRCPVFVDGEEDVLLLLKKNEALTNLVLFECDGDDASYVSKVLGHLSNLQQLRLLMVTAHHYIDSNAFINLGHEIPYLEHFCSSFDWNESTIIKFITRARHLKTFVVLSYNYGCPKVDFIKVLVDIRKSMFPNSSHQIFVLELIIPLKETPGIELDTEMTKYVTVSFLEESTAKHFDSELLELISKRSWRPRN